MVYVVVKSVLISGIISGVFIAATHYIQVQLPIVIGVEKQGTHVFRKLARAGAWQRSRGEFSRLDLPKNLTRFVRRAAHKYVVGTVAIDIAHGQRWTTLRQPVR